MWFSVSWAWTTHSSWCMDLKCNCLALVGRSYSAGSSLGMLSYAQFSHHLPTSGPSHLLLHHPLFLWSLHLFTLLSDSLRLLGPVVIFTQGSLSLFVKFVQARSSSEIPSLDLLVMKQLLFPHLKLCYQLNTSPHTRYLCTLNLKCLEIRLM